MLLTYAAYALMPLCMLRNRPGTGPVIVATLATVTDESGMPTSRLPPVGEQPCPAWGGGASPALASGAGAPGSAGADWPGATEVAVGAAVPGFVVPGPLPASAGADWCVAPPRALTAATWRSSNR